MSARKIGFYAAVAVVVGCFAAGLVVTFAHPDMTRTRLFLTYWPLFAVEIAAGVLAFLLQPDRHSRRRLSGGKD